MRTSSSRRSGRPSLAHRVQEGRASSFAFLLWQRRRVRQVVAVLRNLAPNLDARGARALRATFPRALVGSTLEVAGSENQCHIIGAKEGEPMSERIRYTDEPLGDLEVVPDFLPRPEDLVFRDEGVKVTISLRKRSVAFVKDEARKHNTQYQRMIRRLLDAYVERHANRSLMRSTRTRDKGSRAG